MVTNRKGGSAERPLKRLAFSGAHDTGKTTLAGLMALETHLPGITENTVGSRPTAAGKLMGYERTRDVTPADADVFQMLALMEQYRFERYFGSFVTDRASTCFEAYYNFRVTPSARQAIYSDTVAFMARRYDAIVYLAPLDKAPEDNGMRWTENHAEIDREVQLILARLDLDVITLASDGPIDRMAELCEKLKARGFTW